MSGEATGLRKLRKAAGINLRDAAAALGVKIPELSDFELGTRDPGEDFARRARALYSVGQAVGSTPRRVAIVGARPPTGMLDTDANRAILRRLDDAVRLFVRDLPSGCVVVSGGTLGVDTTAQRDALRRGLATKVWRPDYEQHGKAAPLVRNGQIVDDCDELHAFPAPWSRGTWDAVRRARAAGRVVVVHPLPGVAA